MIENVWCILCKDVITDSKTNLVSYLNCFEGITVLKLPGNLLPFAIGTLWIKTSEEEKILKVRIRSLAPSGEEKPLEAKDMVMKTKRHRFNLVIEGFPIKEEGTYKFIVELFQGEKWEFIKELKLDVNIGKSQINQIKAEKF